SDAIWQSDNFTGQQILDYIQMQLQAGESVTFATVGENLPADCPCTGNHAYTVDHIVADSSGMVIGVVMRNPYGVDRTSTDSNPNDGYVTINAAQAFASMAS